MNPGSPREITIFVSSPSDVFPERARAAMVIERFRSRFREHVTIRSIFFEDRYYAAGKGFQEQIPDAAETDLVISIFWSRLGTQLAPDTFGTMPDGRPYPGGAVYELIRALDANRKKKVPDILVYRKLASAPVSVTDAGSRRLMMEQLDAFEAFWQRWFVSAEGYFRSAYHTFARTDEFEELLEAHLRAWLGDQGLLGKEVVWRIAERGSPYRGLNAYDPEHAEVFFGRQREIERGRERLLAAAERGAGFLLVLGPSGAGKSSLARAGLASVLTRPGDLENVDVVRAAMLRPSEGDTPVRALVDALLRKEVLPELAHGSSRDLPRLEAALAGSPDAGMLLIVDALDRLAAGIRQRSHYDRPVVVKLVLIIDQLEELFVARLSGDERKGFVRLVAALARSGRVLTIATLRSSSYGELVRDPELAALKDDGATLDLAVPGSEVLSEIVRRPAVAAGLHFDRRDDRTLDEVLLESAGGNADALPLLGFTLQWLFEHRAADRLTFAAYDQLGGLEGAIGRVGEQAFAALDDAAQGSLSQLLRGLAEPSPRGGGLALRDMPFESVPAGTAMRRLVDALIAVRVLNVRSTGSRAVLRLAHDAVLRGWVRARDAVARQQDFFRIREEVVALAHRWRRQSRADLLLAPGMQLAEAQSLKAAYGGELEPDLLAFIDASTRKDQTRQRRGYAIAGIFALIALIAIAAGVLAWRLQYDAEEQRAAAERARETAEEQRREADGQQRIAQAQSSRAAAEATRAEQGLAQAEQQRNAALLTQSRFLAELAMQRVNDFDPSVGVLLALAALPDMDAGMERPYSPEAEASLLVARQHLQEIAILTGHKSSVNQVAFSPDGRRVVTASSDNQARIWDASGGKLLKVLDGHTEPVDGAVFSRDGTRVLTSSEDTTVRLWDAESGALIAKLSMPAFFVTDVDTRRPVPRTNYVRSAELSSDGRRILTVSSDFTARIWDVTTGNVQSILDPRAVEQAAFSLDGRRMVTASRPGTPHVWDTATGKEIAVLKGHLSFVNTARFNLDGTQVVTASGDGTARTWDAASGRALATFTSRTSPDDTGSVHDAFFSPDGRAVVSVFHDDAATVWDAKTGKPISSFGKALKIRSARFNPDSRRVLTVSEGNAAQVWDARTGAMLAHIKGHAGGLGNAVFSPDGARVATSSGDATARIWQIDREPGFQTLVEAKSAASWSAFSPDGRRIVVASADGIVRIFDVESRKPLLALTGHEENVNSAAFSPDGHRVVSASNDNTARIWDADSGAGIRVLSHTDEVLRAAFSPDGRRVVTVSRDRRARIWDADNGMLVRIIERHALDADFSPDGRYIVTASEDNTARIWDPTGERLISFRTGHTDRLTRIGFSADGKQFATASADKTVRIWDLEKPASLATLNTLVKDFAFSRDGHRLVMAPQEGPPQIWDIATRKPVATLGDHRDRVASVVFNPYGDHVLTASADNTVRLWPVYRTLQELVDDAKRVIPRCLPKEQRRQFFLDDDEPDWCDQLSKWPYHTVRFGIAAQTLDAGPTFSVGGSQVRGVRISRVIRDLPAAAAGLQVGDIVISINGLPMRDELSFSSALGSIGADQQAVIRLVRGDGTKEVAMKPRS